MDKTVYIVHGSSIVQNGLATILRKNFKLVIKCYSDFASLVRSENIRSVNALFFVEDLLAGSEEYLDFINESVESKSFSIVNATSKKKSPLGKNTIFLYNSDEEIYDLVKHAFTQQNFMEEEQEGLSNREIEVLKLVALGFTNKDIAEKLFISTHTVMSHRKNITEKLGVKSISGLTVYAIINNYIDSTSLNLKDLI